MAAGAERSGAWTLDQAPKHRAPVLGSAAHVASSSEKPQGFSLPGRDGAPWRQNYFFFKGSKHRFYFHSHSPCAPVKGG